MYTTEINERRTVTQEMENTQTQPENGTLAAKNTLHIQMGEISLALVCADDETYHRLRDLYRNFHTEQPPDITVELNLTERLTPDKLEASVFKSKTIPWQGKVFHTSQRIMSGKYDETRRIIKIKGEKNLANPDVKVNHLNRLLTMSYYTACKIKYNNVPPAMFVHTCGILRDGHAVMFTGRSGAGKTTVARFCGEKDGEVLNDEMLLLSRPGQGSSGVNILSAPMLGTFPPQRPVNAPLPCIFFLKQGTETRAQRISNTEAYIRFLRQVISPACIGQKDKKTIYTIMSDFSAQVAGAVPMYELEFNLDGEKLWRTVGEIEKELIEKENR